AGAMRAGWDLARIEIDRGRMSWLVQADFPATGKSECGEEAPTLVRDPAANGAFGVQRARHRLDVVAHQVDLMTAVLGGRVHRDLGRRQREDEPALSGIDVGESEDVAQEGAIRFGILAVDDRMCATDHRDRSPEIRETPRS